MAVPWFSLPVACAVASAQIPQDIDEGKLVIQSATQQIFLPEEKTVYGGGVIATFGVTTVRSDTLTIFFGARQSRGIAEGNVQVQDPEGTIAARRLEFDWRAQTGVADMVTVRIDQLELEAQRLKVAAERWELENVAIRDRGMKPRLFEMWSPSVVIEPRNRTTARRINVSVLGLKVATLRRHEVSLSRKNDGLKLPSVSIKRGAGVGVSWQAGVPLTNSTYTDFRFSSFFRRRPSATLSISRSLVPPERVETLITPRSDLSELFNYGYMENINVTDPDKARNYLSHERVTFGIGSVLNAGVTGRTGSDRITKPWDFVIETGGAPGGFPQMHQLRFQNVRFSGGSQQTRGVGITTVQTPAARLGKNAYALGRFDGRVYLNEGSRFQWGRFIGQAIWQPDPRLRLGIAYAVGANDGEAAFGFDRLEHTRALHLRSDFMLGATTINLLGKYDPQRGDWFDFELALTQAAGAFEPFYVYRKDAGTSTFGVRFRIFDTFDRLKDRLPRRTRGNYPAPPDGRFGSDFDFWAG